MYLSLPGDSLLKLRDELLILSGAYRRHETLDTTLMWYHYCSVRVCAGDPHLLCQKSSVLYCDNSIDQ